MTWTLVAQLAVLAVVFSICFGFCVEKVFERIGRIAEERLPHDPHGRRR